MFQKFFSLDEKKQDRILNAALKEFSQKSYKSASTNDIVKEAEISKGLLFHYFNSKKDLYLFLYEHFIKKVIDEISANLDWDDKDLFLRYRNIATLKMKLFLDYPDMFNFLQAAYREDAPEVKKELDEINQKFTDSSYTNMFGDIDLTKFKEGIDVEKALNIIFWAMEGFASRHQERILAQNLQLDDLDRVFEEMEAYIAILRKAFYPN